jgi:transposase
MNLLRQSNKLNFDGQIFFIGIDVHKKSWTVTLRSNGMQLKTFTMEPNTKKLEKFLKKNYPGGHYFSVYEAGFSGYWLHYQLTELGIRNIVVSPGDVPISNKEKSYKDDSIDSRKLARELENNSLEAIYVPTANQSATRQLSRLYALQSNENKKIKLRIKSFLNYLGVDIPIEVGSRWSNRLINWLEKLELENEGDRYYLAQLIKNMQAKRKEILATLKLIRKSYGDHEVIKLLRTIPGIGLITAFTFYAEIMDIHRFANQNKLASYVGLIPSIKSSGNKTRVQGLNHRQNKLLKFRIIESAWVAVKNDPALTSSYMNYVKRMPNQKAIIKIARKLLNRMRSVWINQKEYQLGRMV